MAINCSLCYRNTGKGFYSFSFLNGFKQGAPGDLCANNHIRTMSCTVNTVVKVSNLIYHPYILKIWRSLSEVYIYVQDYYFTHVAFSVLLEGAKICTFMHIHIHSYSRVLGFFFNKNRESEMLPGYFGSKNILSNLLFNRVALMV